MANLATINNNLLADSGIDPLSIVIGSGTANQISYWIDADTIGALTTATYPSLTELSYVKGVTSAIQTQLNNRLYKDTSQLTGTNLDNMTTSGLYYSADQYSTNTNIPYNNMFVLFNLMNDADRQAQLFFTDTPSTSGGLWWRPKQGPIGWHSWEKIITTVNYNSYSPTLTGTGASGTWGINITGSSATTSAVSGTTNYIPKFTSASAIGNSNLINDNSGNLGLGVNPSAWSSSWRAFEFQAAAIAWTGAGANDFSFSTNSFFDSGDARWEYKGTGDGAARYSITALTSEHRWYNAPVGTAGNAISFTQAMTLKATSQLQLNQYGSGTFTGTRAYDLAIDASGNIIEVAVGAGTVTGTGTTNYIPKWTGTSAIGNSTIYDDGTNVGIGGVSVGSRLSVYSGAGLSGRVFEAYYGSGANQPFNIGINRSSGNAWIGWNAYQSTGDTQVYQLNNTASRITAGSGFVFQVAASGTANNAITWTDAASISTAGNLTTNSWAKFYNVAIGGTATGTYAAYSDSVVGFDNLHLVATGSGAVYINTAIARPTYINPAGGSVGINTTSPGVFTLNVNGTIKGISTFSTYVNDGLFSANARPTTIEMPNGSLLVLGYYSGGNGIYYGRIGWSTATEKVSFGAAATNTFRVGVGIGDTQMFTVNPSGIMSEGYIISNLGYVASTNGTVNNELSHGATFGIVGTTTNHALQIRTNGTTAITVSTSQGVSAVNNISAGTSINWNSGVGGLSYGTGFVTLETNSATSIQFKTNGATAQTIDTSQNVAFANNIGLSNTKAIYFATLADENWKIYRTAAPNFTRSLIGGFSLNINAHYSDEGFAIGANGGNSYYEIEGTGGGTSAEHYFRGIAGIGTLPNASYTLTVGGAFNASSATFSGALTVGTDGIFGSSRTGNDAGATVVNILGSSSSSTSSQLNLTQVWNGVQYPIILRNIYNPTGGAASSIFTLSTTQWNGSIALTTERFRVDGDSGLSTFSGGVNITTGTSPGLNIVKNASTDNRYLRLTNIQASAKSWDLINQTNANGNKFVIYNATDNLSAVEVLTNGGVNFSNTLYLPSSIAGRTAQIEFANSSSANLLGMPNQTTTFYLTYGTNNLHFRNDNAGEMLRLINDGNIYVINNLGIGTAPSYKLDVYRGSSGVVLNLQGIDAYNAETGILMSSGRAKISGFLESSGGTPGSILVFYTMPSGGTMTERLRISSTGESTFSSRLTVSDGLKINSVESNLYTQNGAIAYYSSTNAVYVNGAGPNGWLRLNAAGSENDRNSINIFGSGAGSPDRINFRTGDGTRLTITNNQANFNGNVYAGTTINWYSGIGALSYGTGFKIGRAHV